jgi:hypothetical protein
LTVAITYSSIWGFVDSPLPRCASRPRRFAHVICPRAGLEWFEADLADIIAEKQRLLTGRAARCRVSRVAVDLAEAPSRQAFLTDATCDAHDSRDVAKAVTMSKEPRGGDA